ncbi:MAG: RecBCD enzyme subunit RecD, partial [Mycobacterium sp.]|nr:RecBCD enzyme subunit RecD [Mycobacterium sp.]
MTSVEPVDTASWRRAVGAAGLLSTFNDAAVIDAADVLVAQRLCALVQETDERVELAVALVVRGLRAGSVCLDLRSVEAQVDDDTLPWPAVDDWLAAVWASPLLEPPHVLRRQEHLLYLDRYWREEVQVAEDLLAMVSRRSVESADDIARLFPVGYEEQREAAEIALSQRVTVLTGGPGTGKTTTVARLLALFAGQAGSGARLRIALAAPTGKAAARLQEAVQLE